MRKAKVKTRVLVGAGLITIIAALAVLIAASIRSLPRALIDDSLVRAFSPVNDDLIRAVQTGDNVTLRSMISSGRDIHAKYWFGSGNGYWGEPIHLACKMAHPETVRILIEAGADANAMNGLDETPLLNMAQSDRRAGHIRCAEILVNAGADLHAATRWEHETSLHICAAMRDAPLAVALLRLGANVNAIDAHGDTPLHIACNTPPRCTPSEEVIDLLVRKGASLLIRNREGKTPADYLKDRESSGDAIHNY
jgi:uncharacterized protein